jgi:NADH-ubiquinone oxidoreductase chain 5
LALLAAFLSATYSVRLIIMTFISRPHFPLTLVPFIAEPSFFMLIPLFLLSLGSAIFGYLTQDLFLG